MKLGEAKSAYYELSKSASSVARQLGFAGIAIIWLFCNHKDGAINIPSALIYPTIFIVISLGFDLMQYVIGSLIWGSFNRINEKKDLNDESNVEASKYLNYPSLFFYWGKIITVIISYVLILIYLNVHLNAVG